MGHGQAKADRELRRPEAGGLRCEREPGGPRGARGPGARRQDEVGDRPALSARGNRLPLSNTSAPGVREERSLSPPTREPRRAPDDAAWHEAFLRGFGRLRAELDLHPAESTAAATFEAAAHTARNVARDCLPLGIALVMHLYPLCALRCVPLPWWSTANLQTHHTSARHRPPLPDPRQCRQRARQPARTRP